MPLQATSGAASYDAFGGGVAAVPNYIEDVFSTYLYTGNGSTQTITNGIDLSTKGGLVWIKNRNDVYEHQLTDTSRGVASQLKTESTAAETTEVNRLTSFNSSGFSMSTSARVNASGYTYASWTFRKQPKFFDVVTYTGNGNNRQIAHNLGSVPGFIIIKRTDSTSDWTCYHRSLGNTTAIILNTTAASFTTFGSWDSTTPTSTEFTVGVNATVNSNGGTYVAYLFAHDAGGFGLTGTDNVISCGSFSGNTTVDLGYEPQWVLLKNATSADNWYLIDNMRGWPVQGNGSANTLYANSSVAEQTADTKGTPTATGFTTYGFGGSTGIYIAIRRGPMKVPTSGTSVYATDTAGGTPPNPPLYNSGWPVDLGWYRGNMPNAASNDWYDRLRGQTQTLITNSTDQEQAYGGGNYSFDSNTGWSTQSFVQSDYRAWMFRRSPSFFDVVCYTGNSTAGRAINHNLGVAPELLIVKRRSGGVDSWYCYAQPLGNTYDLSLDSTRAASNADDVWYSTSPTSTTFTVRQYDAVNGSGYTYVAYLFATCAGVSKVGSYTGTGTTKQVDCGFTGGARFVLIKRTDSTGDWYVWDSARGIVSGNDPYLLLNSTAAEVTSTDYVDTYSAGFEISSTAPAAINASGGTFIFLAIA